MQTYRTTEPAGQLRATMSDYYYMMFEAKLQEDLLTDKYWIAR
jgi:hypothetical protein